MPKKTVLFLIFRNNRCRLIPIISLMPYRRFCLVQQLRRKFLWKKIILIYAIVGILAVSINCYLGYSLLSTTNVVEILLQIFLQVLALCLLAQATTLSRLNNEVLPKAQAIKSAITSMPQCEQTATATLWDTLLVNRIKHIGFVDDWAKLSN